MLAAFIDRDGVINELIFNPATGVYESPHHIEDLKIIPSALEALKKIQSLGFEIFVVSNQPSYAKGKTSLEEIQSIANQVSKTLENQGIFVREFYYCFHHPEGIVAEFAKNCECRKPKAGALLEAAKKYEIDLRNSWMIGDQDSDVQCGQAASCQTILIHNPHSKEKRGKSAPTFTAGSLADAARILELK